MNPKQDIERLRSIKTLPSLIAYLRDDLEWPIEADDIEDVFFDYDPAELGLAHDQAAKIKEIKQLRPLDGNQPWGIFWVNFEKKRLPVVMLRRILGHLVVRKRASANKATQRAWHLNDLLFISAYGEDTDRAITLAHFAQEEDNPGDLPVLKVLGWDSGDTVLHLADAHRTLNEKLRWPDDADDLDAWREQWGTVFTLRHREVISTTQALVEELAKLAIAIRKRAGAILARESDRGPMRRLYGAFSTALIHNLNEDDFADVIAQTISYGLLAARFSLATGNISVRNLVEMIPPTNPFLRELLGEFLAVAGRRKGAFDFDELGIHDVVELLNRANAEAVKSDFGNRSRGEDPVIHFYEHFLKAYDKKKKVQRGVFFTPQPVVSYIVRSVHELVQTEFGLEDGLADTTTWGEMARRNKDLKIPDGVKPDDPFVLILDLATGTATFLVEVIEVIFTLLKAKWAKLGKTPTQIAGAWNEYVPKHLLPRLYGYELMMAPYTIAHMKIGLKLSEISARLGQLDIPVISEGRAHIYLTNSLEPAVDEKKQREFESFFPALAHEAAAVNAVKRKKRFTVVIGNPPYSISSANNGGWITDLLEPYKRAVRHERNIQPLSDDYVKFFRFAHWLVLQSNTGLLGLITNHTFLSGLIHRGMRETLLADFDMISILDLHGSALLGLAKSDGSKDENVFDIQQGVSIAIARCSKSLRSSISQHQLAFNELWGERNSKYSRLLDSVSERRNEILIEPEPPNFFFLPTSARDADYDSWASLSEMFQTYSTGFVTGKDEVLISFTDQPIMQLCEALHDSGKSDTEIATRFGLDDTSGWPVRARRAAMKKLPLSKLQNNVRTVMYRPFDQRFTLYCDFLQRARFENMQHMLRPNLGLVASRMVKGEEPAHWYVARMPVEKILLSPKTSNNAVLFPLYQLVHEQELLTCETDKKSNLSKMFLRRLRKALGSEAEWHKPLTPEDIFHYAYAVFHSPEYRTRYAEFLKIDFPRVPLTSSLELFHSLAKRGGELVALHLMESPKINKIISRFIGKGDNFIPKKPTWKDNAVWINSTQCFEDVPEPVWNFHIGGYQVCEKWLKDRKGRRLSKEDIEHYQRIVGALSETIRLMAEIDKVIEQHGGWPGAFASNSNKHEK